MSKGKIYQILDLCLWILNPLMIVLSIYDQKIQPGLFFLWLGKLHPLTLHFPIVFGILITVYFLFFQHRKIPAESEKLLLVINALFASVVAIFGLLFSVQSAYDNQIISLHKWGGIAIALLSWIFIYIQNFKINFKRILSLLFFAILIGSTHKGAQLTHGVNALSFPRNRASETENGITSDKSATIYELGVAPILNQKCIGCHGIDKTKGDLKLNTPENILKGGKNGDILRGDLNEKPIIVESIHLPLADEKHMPPDGKLQLTSDEIDILTNWIKAGSNFKLRLNELNQDDSLFILVTKYQAAVNQKAARKSNLPDLTEFNTDYCSTNYLFNGSDKVEVNFFQGSFYNRKSLIKLDKIKHQIVSLNMQGMPLTNVDLDIIIQFDNLQKVNLNSTNLDIASIEVLKSLTKLEAVSICGIEFDEAALDKFLDHAKFSSLNVWTNSVNEKQLEKLKLKYPAIDIIVGDNLEYEIMKITTPTIVQDSSVFLNQLEVKIKHLLKGVVIRYTTDGSDPDSLKSREYIQPIKLLDNTVLKAKAFKTGWITSDIVQRTFYKSEIHPDTIFLVTNPHPRYFNKGAKALIDFELGENNISNGEWLTYKDYAMEFIIGFSEATLLNSAHLNSLVDTRASIFPINSITVHGSNDGKQYINISEVNFPKPYESASRTANTYSCNFPESTSFKYYKFIVTNFERMPAWHTRKGEPAWIFVDELFLN